MSDLEKLKLHLRRFQNGVAEYPNRTISMIEELETKVDELTAELENAEGYLRDASDSSQWEDYINGVPHFKSEYTKEGK